MSSKPNPGAFKKGSDPRRHKFTREEWELGYERARLSVDERHPDWRCVHGAALSHCLLRAVRPGAYVAHKAEQKALRSMGKAA